ncbi:hypothetical protein [Butyrivibrio sp. YAB3001]|uniref:hypothetical protein n=1 Tax=Butyrivibrio sp. YAB3001 TaxID=1520812 RepID=UPI001131F89E|nr:hypothetical protein [Butyrivibrio sp. YAB3001]
MKKRILITCIMSMSLMLLSACGGNNKVDQTEKEINEFFENELTDEDKEVLNEIASELEKDLNSEEQTGNETDENMYSSDFEPLPEIINASYTDGKVQVGKDMIFQLHSMTFADVNKIINESSEASRYEWEEYDKYVPEQERITLKLDGKNYLVFHFANTIDYGNAKIKIDDCRLNYIQSWNYPGTVYYAGGIRSDGKDINFDNIESLFEGYENGSEYIGDSITPFGAGSRPNTWTYSDWTGLQGHSGYDLSVVSEYGFSREYFQTCYYPYIYNYHFYIDLSTGECDSVEMSFVSSGVSYEDLGLNHENYIVDDNSVDNNAESDDTDEAEEDSSDSTTEIWGDISVKEYVDEEFGIHFYLPSELEVTTKEPLYNSGLVNKAYYVTGMGMNNEYLCQAEKCSDSVYENSDAPEDELYGEIDHKNGYHYSINFWDPETQYNIQLSDAMVKIISTYRQKILDSAWVE